MSGEITKITKIQNLQYLMNLPPGAPYQVPLQKHGVVHLQRPERITNACPDFPWCTVIERPKYK